MRWWAHPVRSGTTHPTCCSWRRPAGGSGTTRAATASTSAGPTTATVPSTPRSPSCSPDPHAPIAPVGTGAIDGWVCRRGRGSERREVRGELVEAGLHAGLRFGAAVLLGHVRLVDDHLGATVAQVREGAGVRHPTFDVGLGPDDALGLDDLDEHAARRVLLAVLVVDHDGLETAARVRLDDDAVEGCAHPGRTPEVGEVLGLDHAAEDELTRRVVDAGDDHFAEGGGFAHF